MGLTRRRLLLSTLYHGSIFGLGLGSLWLGMTLHFQPCFDAGGILILIHLLTCRRSPLSRHLQQRLIRTHHCASCGVTFDLEDQWKCKCGFISRARSALAPCPQCHKGFAAIACPHCSTSAIL